MDITLGQIAYEGYFRSCGGKSLVSGQPLPAWEAQAEDIKNAWEEAAVDVANILRDTGALTK